jgi:hypothetical protein
MYETARLSITYPVVEARMNELLATASETRGSRRPFALRLSWPGRPRPLAGHRPARAS